MTSTAMGAFAAVLSLVTQAASIPNPLPTIRRSNGILLDFVKGVFFSFFRGLFSYH